MSETESDSASETDAVVETPHGERYADLEINKSGESDEDE